MLEIAERIGYDNPHFIYLVENNKALIPVRKMAKFAEAYEVDDIQLLKLFFNEKIELTKSKMKAG